MIYFSTIIQSSNNTAKYSDDNKHEPFLDNYIYFPLAESLIDPLKNIGLTPNMVTIISTFFTLLSIYFLHKDNKHLAVISYLFGYLLDCVDGKMARKYNMCSKLGMVLDATSDVISNSLLSLYILYRYQIRKENLILVMITCIMSFLLILSYALNEAIISYKETGSDDFYTRRYNELNKENCNLLVKLLNNIFLIITCVCYNIYKYFFPIYNQNNINKWLPLLKEMGPGTINTIVAILIYNL